MRNVQIGMNEAITYVLIRKHVKNLNLRVKENGEVTLTVPYGCTAAQADDFVFRKSEWIVKHINRQKEEYELDLLPQQTRENCCRMLYADLQRVYPTVKRMGIVFPELKVRSMRTQWGNCHWTQGYITLNENLHRCPEYLRDYVILHELLHFIYHDHGREFYFAMDAFMPDWRERRKELKKYAAMLIK